jgi:hypothetical protein
MYHPWPYNFQADLIWCDGPFKEADRKKKRLENPRTVKQRKWKFYNSSVGLICNFHADLIWCDGLFKEAKRLKICLFLMILLFHMRKKYITTMFTLPCLGRRTRGYHSTPAAS